MNYIKCKYLKDGEPHGRTYTFKADFPVQFGDIVLASGKKVVVVPEPVNMAQVRGFGEERIRAVEKYETEGNIDGKRSGETGI